MYSFLDLVESMEKGPEHIDNKCSIATKIKTKKGEYSEGAKCSKGGAIESDGTMQMGHNGSSECFESNNSDLSWQSCNHECTVPYKSPCTSQGVRIGNLKDSYPKRDRIYCRIHDRGTFTRGDEEHETVNEDKHIELTNQEEKFDELENGYPKRDQTFYKIHDSSSCTKQDRRHDTVYVENHNARTNPKEKIGNYDDGYSKRNQTPFKIHYCNNSFEIHNGGRMAKYTKVNTSKDNNHNISPNQLTQYKQKKLKKTNAKKDNQDEISSPEVPNKGLNSNMQLETQDKRKGPKKRQKIHKNNNATHTSKTTLQYKSSELMIEEKGKVQMGKRDSGASVSKFRGNSQSTNKLHRNKLTVRPTEIHSSNIEVEAEGQDNEFPLLYRCSQCHLDLVDEASYNRHKRLHSLSRPFPCPECPRRFNQLVHLQIHRTTHSGERPFHCSICGATFNRKDRLKSHERTHSGVRHYPCPYCLATFSDAARLRVHLPCHHPLAPPYTCRHCQATFAHLATFTTHWRQHIDAAT